jgi:hypothetical protein
MDYVSSKDGTKIAFDRLGEGPRVILVSGGSVDRSSNAPLADLLARIDSRSSTTTAGDEVRAVTRHPMPCSAKWRTSGRW